MQNKLRNSPYYIGNWEGVPRDKNSLLKFVNAIKSGGVGLIILLSSTHDYYPIRKEMTPQLYPGAEEQYGEQLIPALDALGISRRLEVVQSRFDVSPCFDGDAFSPAGTGKHIVSWILRADWDQQPVSRKSRVETLIRDAVAKNGKKELICRDLFIWLPKAAS